MDVSKIPKDIPLVSCVCVITNCKSWLFGRLPNCAWFMYLKWCFMYLMVHNKPLQNLVT